MTKKYCFTFFMVWIFFGAFVVSGCKLFSGNKLEVKTNRINSDTLTLSISSIDVSNNLITVNGTGLLEVTEGKITGTATDVTLNVQSKNSSQILFSANSPLSLLVGNAFQLVLSSATAQASFPITFTLQDGAVTASKLHAMGATSGQVLKYNGSAWAPASVTSSQTYLGAWNANTNVPDIDGGGFTSGEYYIVTTAGTHNAVSYNVGDWVMYDGASWDKIDNSSNVVSSFHGRRGIVTLQPSDYVSLRDTGTQKVTGSKLSDIADIDLTGLADGQVLKWSSGTSKWVPANDASGSAGIALTDLSASSPLSYNNTTGVFSLANTSITNSHISGTAAIDQSKIANLTTDLSGKQSSDATLTSLAAFNTNGILVQTAADTFVGRTINGTTNRTSVTNGNGVSGNPVIDINTTLLPSPAVGDSGKFLKATAADTSVWTALGSSDVTAALGFTPINKSSDTISSGTLLFNGTALLSVPNPVNLTDAVNKQYVDDTISANGVWTKATSDIYYNTGNVGIGTNLPGAKLHVEGTSTSSPVRITRDNNTNSSSIGMYPNGALSGVNPAWAFGLTAGSSNFNVITNDGTTSTTRFSLDTTGNVGVGTTAPTSGMTFGSTKNSLDLYNTVDQVTNYERSRMFWSSNVFNFLVENGGTGTGRAMKIGTTGKFVNIGNYAQQGILNFDSSGATPNISGMGTNGQQTQSSGVFSMFSILPRITQSGTAGYRGLWISSFEDTVGSGSALLIDAGTNSAVNGGGTHTSRFAVTSSGKVGVGTATPSSVVAGRPVVHIQDTTGNGAEFRLNSSAVDFRFFNSNSAVGFGTDTAHDFYVFTGGGGNERMRITGSGTINLGTNSVSTTTNIYGRVETKGSVTSNAISTITATLNANNGTQSMVQQIQPPVQPTLDIAAFYGLIFLPYLQNSSNNITSSHGVYSRMDLNATYTGIVTEHNNFTSGNPTVSGGTLTSLKGFRSSITSGSDRWNLFIDGTANNYIAANLGIGTNVPGAKLDVVGTAGSQIRVSDTTSNTTNKNGYVNLRHYNTAEEDVSLFIGTSSNTASTVRFGGGSGVLNAATEVQFYTAANNTTLTGTQRMTIDSNGDVGIGNTSPAYPLDVTGDVNLTSALRISGTQICTSAGCTAVSDQSLKENIIPIVTSENEIKKILTLNPVEYFWKNKTLYGDKKQIGLIAQEVEKIYPEVVVTDKKSNIKTIAYQFLIAPLITGFKYFHEKISKLVESDQRQSREIASLKNENEKLKKENREILKRLEILENSLKN